MLYADAPEFFDEEEVRLLDEMAMDIGFALEAPNGRRNGDGSSRSCRASERALQEYI